jgi:carbamate kinase
VEIVEIETVRDLLEAGPLVVAAGGGGIPVMAEGLHLKGMPAVIDKDFASEKLAEMIDADVLIILTAVEKVAENFKKPGEKWLDGMTVDEAKAYIREGQFAPGSMLPKVEAAVLFAGSKPGRYAMITLLEKALDGVEGRTGTVIRA